MKKLLIIFLCLGLTGCAAMQTTEPKTFNEKIAYLDSAITAIDNTAAILYKNKKISKKVATDIYDSSVVLSAQLDTAEKDYQNGDNNSAEIIINQSTTLLNTLEDLIK